MISFALIKSDLSKKLHPNYDNEVINQLPAVISTRNPKYYMLIFNKILEQYIANEVSSSLLIRSLILEMIYAVYQEVNRYYLPSSAYMSVIKKAISFIETNYRDKLSLDLISHHVNLSPSHFQKIFKETMHVSPNDYLINYRLTKAKELLLITDDSITDITYNCGFESNAYFSYVFKHKMMMTPTLYRKSHQKP
jgi:AraC-like DNA-binding protein